MSHRITVGLKGGILLVASVAEIAVRLLLLVGGAPLLLAADGLDTRLFLPLGGCWRLLEYAGETAGLCDCRRWPLALVCLWASGFGGAGLGFALRVGAALSCVFFYVLPWNAQGLTSVILFRLQSSSQVPPLPHRCSIV
jgi:hypothetical protein